MMRRHNMLSKQQYNHNREQFETELYPEHEKMKPYISFVAVARNDDHGGNFLDRMQVFISALLQQIKKHNLNAELIIVDWNPLGDRPKLSQVLSSSFSSELFKNIPCKIRIIEVPSEIHKRFQYFDKISLFQMIGKNVGIRRARGEFVVATNVDLLFSDDLIKSLVSKSLKPEFIYRIDRNDVDGIPYGASVREQLDYCENNVIRVHRKDGSFAAISRWGIFLIKCKIDLRHFRKYFLSNFRDGCSLIQSIYRDARTAISSYIQDVKELIHFYKKNRKRYKYSILMKMTKIGVELTAIGVFLVAKQTGKGIYIIAKLAVEGIVFPVIKTTVQLKKMIFPLYPRLHTNGCGDFTMMTKEKWHELRGYPELEIFSFNLDSLILQMAYESGLREKILKDPLRMYHMEHDSGWTPESCDNLFNRLRETGIPFLSHEKFVQIASKMHKNKSSMISNKENWGLGSETLPEVCIN